MPAALLNESALRHNIAEMQAFADRVGAWLCPHGKTSMSPELFAMQLRAGAWGLTAATAHHVRVYRHLGVERIFLANILAASADIDLILREIAESPSLDFYCLVDSPAAADLLAAGVRRTGCRPIKLLIETGAPGGRAGARSLTEAVALARHLETLAPCLTLCGVETFEGIAPLRPDARADAGAMLDLAVGAATAIVKEGLLGDGPLLLSAGGSAFLDLCAARLPDDIDGRRVRRVIRPGCYVTHDHGLYRRLVSPPGGASIDLPSLWPALEVWGPVISLPEPELAIIGLGKRDVSHDVEPPLPLKRLRPETGQRPSVIDGMKVVQMWDQHLSLASTRGELHVGDLIGFGVSHPCATFDRWSAMLKVDDDYGVTGVVTTLF